MRRYIYYLLAGCLLVLLPCGRCAQGEVLTEEQVYARILDNFGKIKNLKGKVVIWGNDPDFGQTQLAIDRTDNFYYKAPRKFMLENYGAKTMRVVTVDDKKMARNPDTGRVQKNDFTEDEFTTAPQDPSFYERMISYFRKYQIVSIVKNLTPDEYKVAEVSPTPPENLVILHVVPKDPESHMVGHEGMDVEITVDMARGVLTNMQFRDPHTYANAITRTIQWEDIQEIAPGIFFPMRIKSVLFWYTLSEEKSADDCLAHPKVYRSMLEYKDLDVNKTFAFWIFKP